MWKFNFGKNKKEQKDKAKDKESNALPQYINYHGDKCYWIEGIKVLHERDGIETYVANAYVTNNEYDAILIDFPSPIAFELPKGRPDLINNLIQMFDKTKSGRELSEQTYTYIGNIKPDLNGNLYYRNEPPSSETAKIIQVEERKFQRSYAQKIETIRERQRINEKRRREEEFLDQIRIDQEIEKKRKFENQIRMQRLKRPYFKRQDDFGPNLKEGYDAINLNDGNIMLIRNMEKFKDRNGRYLYTAYIRQVNTEMYTEYSFPIGNQVVFTTPGRLSDIIANQNMYGNLTNSIQKMLSDAASFLEKNQPKKIVDIGGVLENGQIVENSEKFGISKALIGKIQSLGATPIKNNPLDR